MSISNRNKRELTCQFCDRQKEGCKCKKYWKSIYREHREEILTIYNKNPSQQSKKFSNN